MLRSKIVSMRTDLSVFAIQTKLKKKFVKHVQASNGHIQKKRKKNSDSLRYGVGEKMRHRSSKVERPVEARKEKFRLLPVPHCGTLSPHDGRLARRTS